MRETARTKEVVLARGAARPEGERVGLRALRLDFIDAGVPHRIYVSPQPPIGLESTIASYLTAGSSGTKLQWAYTAKVLAIALRVVCTRSEFT